MAVNPLYRQFDELRLFLRFLVAQGASFKQMGKTEHGCGGNRGREAALPNVAIAAPLPFSSGIFNFSSSSFFWFLLVLTVHSLTFLTCHFLK